jgi:hypothetical protein
VGASGHKEVTVNLGRQRPGIAVWPLLGRAGLPVRREWIIQVPAPTEEPPLQAPEPAWPEPEPVPLPEEAPA